MLTIDITTLRDHVGQEVAVSNWMTISQAQIDQFADATGDRQWIHVDPVRARAESPYQTTIAHGFLSLSLISSLLRDAIQLTGLRLAINYGLNRVRFPGPVPTGSRIRGRFALEALDELGDGIQAAWRVTVERDGSPKPCVVAEWIVRYYR
ncbi:MAG TPA: MaoC family dehydratase [Vicinamibacterales bacterium]|nr:MaoC family dehydratase [Vicinamibacterales bacterium]